MEGTSPFSPGRPTRPRRVGRIFALVVCGVLILAVAGGYLVAGTALTGSERGAADRTLQRVGEDTNSLAALWRLSSVLQGSLDPSAATFVSATVAKWASGGAARFDYAQTTVVSDTSRLRQTSSRLRSDYGSLPLLLSRPMLDQRRARIEAAVDALAALDQYCSIVIEQMTFVAAVFDAFAAWDANLVVIGYQHDLNGALDQLPQVDQAVQAVSRLAAGAHIPPQIVNLRAVLASEVANYEALLRAVKAGDTRAVITRLPGLEQRAAEKVDDKAVAAFESLLFTPLHDRYITSMRAAALTVTGAV